MVDLKNEEVVVTSDAAVKGIQEVFLDLEVVLDIWDIILRERGSFKITLAIE